ncbi:ribosomal-protein-alanine N-acetyltransferase [Stenotrophomonas sp. CC120223-11]|nr:ribosomal-protein-alanine N-acetyltransferase [Stenotrophomonas sp. CC120223-11]
MPTLPGMPASLLPSLPDTLPARLRALRMDDAAAWSRYLSLPGVIEHTSWNEVSEAALRQLIAGYLPTSPDQRWALVDAGDRLIGTFGLNGIDLLHGRGELAYDLDPHWQGQGLATQAARAVLDWGHAVRSLTRIQATVLDSNARSIAVLERLDMQREGLLHAYRNVRGRPRNFWMYAHLEGTVASPL